MLAFRRDVARASAFGPEVYAEGLAADRSGFLAQLDAERRGGRLGSFVAMAQVAHHDRSLSAKVAVRLVSGLLALGRPHEALQVLKDRRYGFAEDPALRPTLARALAATGQMTEALAAAESALALEPGDSAAVGLAEALRDLNGQISAIGDATPWPVVRDLVDRLLALGATKPALEAVRAFLKRGPPIDRTELVNAYRALAAILSLSGQTDVRPLFGLMRRLHPGREEQRDLEMILQGLTEDPSSDVTGLARLLSCRHRGLRLAGALAWSLAGRRAAAIIALSRIAARFQRDLESRNLLARHVGQDVLEKRGFTPVRQTERRKVFDVFPFYNEFEILEIKLNEMADWVDHFVIVEATQTFTGMEKPLNFKDRRHAYAKFEAKIIHVVVDDYPAYIDTAWAREFYQRDMGVVGLQGRCAKDDLVMITDVDEIVSRSAIDGFKGSRARLLMERSRYFLNYREQLSRGEQRGLASVWRAEYLRTCGLSYLRQCNDKKAPAIHDAGWHFTSVADLAGMLLKFQSTSHQEYADLTPDQVDQRLAAIQAGALEPGWERCDVDERFPAFIRENQDRLSHLLLKPPLTAHA
jgi:beta-1,4-mannosyl-glycoprotein beta-1,4-N-acetylglucosaminyltransferase